MIVLLASLERSHSQRQINATKPVLIGLAHDIQRVSYT